MTFIPVTLNSMAFNEGVGTSGQESADEAETAMMQLISFRELDQDEHQCQGCNANLRETQKDMGAITPRCCGFANERR